MKREIKFRAWDKKKKEWADNTDSNWLLTPDGDICEYNDVRWTGGWHDITDYVLMQYTGLKDKHGVEVYEGDIVKCQIGCPHVVEWRQELGGEFVGGMPGWYLSELRSGFGRGYAWMGDEEVIGNIYQNPELLK